MIIDKIKEKIKNNNIRFDILLFVFLMTIPYLGLAGSTILNSVGDYFTFIYLISVLFMYVAYIKDGFLNVERLYIDKTYIYFVLINSIYVILLFIISNLSIDKTFFMIVFLIYPFILSARGINNETLKALGYMSLVICLFEIGYAYCKTQFFNINTYSFIIVLFASLSLFIFADVKNNFIKIIYAAILFSACAYVVKIQYDCDTQLIASVFVGVLYIFRVILKNKIVSNSLYTLCFLLMVFLPLISLILIDEGLLTIKFLTSRGERWYLTMEAIKEAGAFIVPSVDPMAHNAFLDIALKFTIQEASVFIILFFMLGLKIIKKLPKDEYSLVLIIILVYYMLISSVESFIMPLAEWGWTALVIGLLLAKTKPMFYNKLLEVKGVRYWI